MHHSPRNPTGQVWGGAVGEMVLGVPYGCRRKVDDSPTGGRMSQLTRNIPFARSQLCRASYRC